uniref:Uncharacterized protein n=1 Tax=Anopheles atroparvus TaxID=41427 RepID=A0AAG5CSZ0_ANOAO
MLRHSEGNVDATEVHTVYEHCQQAKVAVSRAAIFLHPHPVRFVLLHFRLHSRPGAAGSVTFCE